MPRTVVDPYTQVANVIEAAVLSEFSDIAYLTFHHDRIHESLGSDGKTHVAVSPEVQSTRGADLTQEILIQFYGPFNADVDPYQSVDPRLITVKAERLRQALEDVHATNTPQAWFFNVRSTEYTRDATDNKSRFEMRIEAWGNNTALFETVG